MIGSLPFNFEVPISFFEKSDAEIGRQKRIGGIITTESKDRQGEVILQRGLDFGDFLTYGWYNDNHSKATTDILGYPEKVAFFRKGQSLPDGTLAKADGHWAEGYLLDTDKANKVWELGKALQKSGRRLGYSVEGSIDKRIGRDRKTIAKARVKNVAITNCPVNADSRLETLAKSLIAVEEQAAQEDEARKALTAGAATPGVAPVGPRTGEGAGQVLMPESLETDKRLTKKQLQMFDATPEKPVQKSKRDEVRKSLTVAEAVAWVRSRLPNASLEQAGRIVDVTLALKRSGKL
jgi:hypothetical protein